MQFAIRYLTEYRYDAPVTDNLNALRVKPASTATQRVDDFAVRVDPETRLAQHLDYFGTTVLEFGIYGPHERLSIDVRARVTVTPPPAPPEASWTQIETANYAAAGGEFRLPYSSDPQTTAVEDLAGLIRARTPLATLRRLVEIVPSRFEYRQGVTYVNSTVEDLLAKGAGVCQDFAHLSLVLLRRHGIACRYVSGYLFAQVEPESPDAAEVQTHAWLEALMPAIDGGQPFWVAADPTNRRLAGESHVKIGHGRHYADVAPIKGVYRGAGGAELETSVRMTRIDEPVGRLA